MRGAPLSSFTVARILRDASPSRRLDRVTDARSTAARARATTRARARRSTRAVARDDAVARVASAVDIARSSVDE
jgi:hypothetical protein